MLVKQITVNIHPLAARTHTREIGLAVVSHAIQQAEINSYAIVDVVGANDGVASAAKSDVPISCSVVDADKCSQGEGDFFRCAWLNQTPRMKSTVERPPAVYAWFVVGRSWEQNSVGEAGGDEGIARRSSTVDGKAEWEDEQDDE